MPKVKEGAERGRRRYAKRLQPADRREQLLDAALRIVAEGGFADVSIAALAERAGVTRPVVYDSFGSRDEVLQDLIERETSRMQVAVERAMAEPFAEAPSTALATGLSRFLDEVRAMPDTWRLVYFPIAGVPPALRARVERARDDLRAPLQRMIGEWLAGRSDAETVDLDVLVLLTQGVIQTAARLALDDPEHFDTERLVGLLAVLFTPELPSG